MSPSLQVTKIEYSLSVPSNKLFQKRAIFLCLQKVDLVTNYCKKAPILLFLRIADLNVTQQIHDHAV